jgi:hypothetical protein
MRGAFATTVLRRKELLRNGRFGSNTTGWTGATNGVLTAPGGVLRITNSGGTNGRANSDAMVLVVGAKYRLSYRSIARTADSFTVQIRDGVGAGTITATSGVFSGAVATSIDFTAAGSHTVVLYAIGADGTYAEYDSVSVRRA